MDLDTARDHHGDKVLYQPVVGEPSEGYIMAVNEKFVHVRYSRDITSRATRPEDLTLLTGRCPDGGSCHHGCPTVGECFRVACCGPLSGVYPGDRWPADVLATHKRKERGDG